jgi:hypothetical protein
MGDDAAGSPEWDEHGERVVATDVCVHCGEPVDEWEIRIETAVAIRRLVLLWKHHSDGAVLCARGRSATPASG